MSTVDPLQGLSIEEKRSLYDRLEFDLSTKRMSFERAEMDMWDSIVEVCPGVSAKAMTSIVISYGRKRYADKVNDVENYISDSCSSLMRLPARNAVRAAVLKCLVNWMKDNGITVSVTSFLNSLHFLPGAVEESFPGYADCRLLHRVAMIAA